MSERRAPLWVDLTADSSREEVMAAVEEYEARDREAREALARDLREGRVWPCRIYEPTEEELAEQRLGEPGWTP